jgi:hypothetical protein
LRCAANKVGARHSEECRAPPSLRDSRG